LLLLPTLVLYRLAYRLTEQRDAIVATDSAEITHS
jgi:hypothetical protein